MEKRGKGTFLVTTATAAFRGNAGQHSHASAMGGRRMLASPSMLNSLQKVFI